MTVRFDYIQRSNHSILEMNTTELKNTVGKNKEIPAKYEKVILEALAGYPELKDTHIVFKLKKQHPVPYGTVPLLGSLFQKPENRVYHIAILEESKPPEEQVLFRNLSYPMQLGVIAHELVHVIQFQECSRLRLLRYFLSYPTPAFQRRLERDADKRTIEHGFGEELLTHARYIRSVPGYVEQRKAINENYLKPQEILDYMTKLKAKRPGQHRRQKSQSA